MFLTLNEVVERYRGQISEGTLRNWRSMRIGPSFIKIGKAILYPLEELDRWDRRNLVVCRPSRSLPWRKRRSDMCLILQLALTGMLEPRWISIRNPSYNVIGGSRENIRMILRFYHDL
jgi:hypothetical protein